MATGIYRIALTSSKFYIGSTSRSFEKRWNEHRSDLRNGRHRNRKLQAAWNKYGESRFEFDVLCECDPNDCSELEHLVLITIAPYFNLAMDTDAPFKGRKHSSDSIEKCRHIRLGKKFPPLSDAHRVKLSVVGKGRKRPPRTDQWNKNASVAQMGKVLSAEHRANISKGGKGTTRPPVSDLHRMRISRAKIGTKLGVDNPAARSVRCVENAMVFVTIKDAETWLRESKPTACGSNISSCCTGKLKTAYSYHWEYADTMIE